MALTEPVLKFLQSHRQSCTVVVLDMFPKKYWWPILVSKALKSKRLAVQGDSNALLVPFRKGWVPHKGIPGDLWAFTVCFKVCLDILFNMLCCRCVVYDTVCLILF